MSENKYYPHLTRVNSHNEFLWEDRKKHVEAVIKNPLTIKVIVKCLLDEISESEHTLVLCKESIERQEDPSGKVAKTIQSASFETVLSLLRTKEILSWFNYSMIKHMPDELWYDLLLILSRKDNTEIMSFFDLDSEPLEGLKDAISEVGMVSGFGAISSEELSQILSDGYAIIEDLTRTHGELLISSDDLHNVKAIENFDKDIKKNIVALGVWKTDILMRSEENVGGGSSE